MWNELRMLIAEWLLGLVIKVAPNNDEGYNLVFAIMKYLEDKLNERDAK